MAKKNRVDCANCMEFIFPDFKFSMFKPISPAKCNLGKRVAFRVNGLHPDSSNWECGWFRYCDEFNGKINEK